MSPQTRPQSAHKNTTHIADSIMINPTQIENMSPENWQRFLHVHDRDETLPKAQRTRALSTKVTSLGHITNSYTNLDQTYSESRPSTNFKISTKHQHFDKNLNLKIFTKPSFRISTKVELHNHNQASIAKQ